MKIKKIQVLILFLIPFLSFAKELQKDSSIVRAEKQGKIEFKTSFLKPLQKRDSILIADQLEYGFCLDKVKKGTELILPDFKDSLVKNIEIVKNWEIDTLKTKKDYNNLMAKILITSFEEGDYTLPQLSVIRINEEDNTRDTLIFESQKMQVKTIPIDTAKFELHEIKEQIKYPISFKEVLPYILVACLLILIISSIFYFVNKYKKRKKEVEAKEPAHIKALRQLDSYMDNKYWEVEQQKLFYSAVTDIIREYLKELYKIDALEMTTAEIFEKLKKKPLKIELYMEMQTLFKRADFVKFAKYVASNEENAKVLPIAVNFVTTTYQDSLKEQIQLEEKQRIERQKEDNSAYMPKNDNKIGGVE